jgi:hypothetical protein
MLDSNLTGVDSLEVEFGLPDDSGLDGVTSPMQEVC